MSGRKDVIRTFPLMALVSGNKVPMDLAASFESEVVNVCFEDNLGFTLVWAGTAPVGEIKVFITNQKDEPGVIRDFVELDFGSAISISGNSGNHLVNINQCPFEAFKLSYTRASGIGTLKCFVQAKSV